MLVLRPLLHDLVGSAASRTVAQLQALGVELGERQVTIGIRLHRASTWSQRLLTEAMVDMLLRLDPLVAAVVVDAGSEIEHALVDDLSLRLPIEHSAGEGSTPDLAISVGSRGDGADLIVDGGGWAAALGEVLGDEPDQNPIGPLGAACFGTGEAFKWAFSTMYPAQAAELQLTPWRGSFSFLTYEWGRATVPMGPVRVDATLVGAGGVGAGFLRAMVALEERVGGRLVLIDADCLSTDNLNRVTYATVEAALAGRPKVVEAAKAVRARCPRLDVIEHERTFDQCKQLVPRREDRLYDVVVTGLDNDEARWDVQRDLPRILVDGATGRDMNIRVERVEFGRYGCLGCTRRGAAVDPDANCDDPPDKRAPSLSFLAAFPGILAAGELIKEASGLEGLRGGFDHVFRYGPNPDMVGTPGFRSDCSVGCQRPARLNQFRRKYPDVLIG